ncbi:MAG: N-6 DNA methylase [Rhizobiales bacterium]|nr:N-6 DNA methylase [Hyphomicrobiales bacterium]
MSEFKRQEESTQLEHIGEIERRLWSSADNLRANSNFASNEYFMPVMGLIFLRHAYSRFLKVKEAIEPTLPKRGGKARPLKKEDFSQKGAIFLQPQAQFDHLVGLTDANDRAKAIIDAMDSIEADYETLKGALPKQEYQELDNEVLGSLLRTFNDPALKRANGDIFGRIYEYFLTQFADQKAHDGGEFFTPVSLVQMIVNVIEPEHGRVLDPACGSGGMFVQSAHFIERMHMNPMERVTFYGMEKNPTTIRLAKMNLAVHGLEGDIARAISYYEEPHELVGKCDFVMANPPFNVDEVDAEKAKKDPRLNYGLPGVNKKGKVGNGNYLWISYFDAYLTATGRAGFVMSSQASSAGGGEAEVRKQLIKAGHVDIMMAIRGNFFYTRTVPCELWFLDKAKAKEHADKVLMIDARGVYRKVTRKIYDFSPEQQANLTAIVWLYRGQQERFFELLEEHLERAVDEARRVSGAYAIPDDERDEFAPLSAFVEALDEAIATHTKGDLLNGAGETAEELEAAAKLFRADVESFVSTVESLGKAWEKTKGTMKSLTAFCDDAEAMANASRDLIKQADHLYKLLSRVVEAGKANGRGNPLRALDAVRKASVEQLKHPRYFWRQAHWLVERFPEGKLRDVPGLVKLLDFKELEANDWSLTPGRYVGVAPEEEDEDFDFEETLREIHVELEGLNAEAAELAAKIARNFEELGV